MLHRLHHLVTGMGQAGMPSSATDLAWAKLNKIYEITIYSVYISIYISMLDV